MVHLITWNMKYACITASIHQHLVYCQWSVQHLPTALPPAAPVVMVTLRFWCSMGSRDCSVCSSLGRWTSLPSSSPFPPSPLPPSPPPLWGVLLPPHPAPLAAFSGVIDGSLHWTVESLRSLHLSRLYILASLPVPSVCFNLDGTIGCRNLVLRS